MFVRCNPNKKNIKYLSYVRGYRDKNGLSRQVTIEKIGDWVDLIKLYDDPIKHFNDLASKREKELDIDNNIDFNIVNEPLSDNVKPINLGYIILKIIYNEIGLYKFFKNKQNNYNIDYSLNDIFELLIFSRILFPASKNETFNNKDNFFSKNNFSLKDLYRSLDIFNSFNDELLKLIWDNTKKNYKRDTTNVYYDCTNYYFEINYNDEDLVDEDGNILEKRYRKKGPSKEHKPEPIIGMGLLMDNNGIPMSYNLYPGNESEKLSLRPELRKTKSSFGIDRVITVADRGLNTSDNTFFIAGKNDDDHKNHDGYVFGQSVLASDKEFKDWVLKQNDYFYDKVFDDEGNQITFKHKSRIFAKTVTIVRDKVRKSKTTIYQKQMIYYSERYAQRQKKQRDLAIKKAIDLINNPTRYTLATSVGAAQYINNFDYNKKTGEVIAKDLSLNLQKIENEEKFDGYFSIVTSELNMSDEKMREVYKGLWKIEESFKITKSALKARPVHVWTKQHIEAHFLTCFVSLVILRLLESKVGRKYSLEKIISSLKKLNCSHIYADNYCINFRNEIIKYIEPIFNVDFSNKYINIKKIKNFIK